MDPLDQLGTIAEIAATYSGFIAVFIAFVGRDGRFAAADAHFVQAMVLATLFTLVCALAPRVLSLFIPSARLWLASSIVAFVISAPIGVYQAWAQMRMPDHESQKISMVWHVPGWALAAASGVSFILALTGWISAQGFYLAGTTFSLGIAVWCFVAIVFRKFF
jgi:ABC-type dipeptide/oligopeptide/nickel transport system permease component